MIRDKRNAFIKRRNRRIYIEGFKAGKCRRFRTRAYLKAQEMTLRTAFNYFINIRQYAKFLQDYWRRHGRN